MNSERPPESASSTPTGPGGSEGLREGLGYFLFESRRPFEHVTCVPRARPQQGQHASPAGRSHRRPRRRQGGKGWQGRRQGRWQGLWPCGAPDPLCAANLNARYSVEPAERRRQSCGRRRPHTASSAVETAPRAAARCATTAAARIVAMDASDPLCAAALNARYSIRAGGATAAELRPPATFPSTTPPTRRQARADCHREEGDGGWRIRSPRAQRARVRARAGAREPGQRRRQCLWRLCRRRAARPSPVQNPPTSFAADGGRANERDLALLIDVSLRFRSCSSRGGMAGSLAVATSRTPL